MLDIIMFIGMFHDVYLPSVRPSLIYLICRFRHHPYCLSDSRTVIDEPCADIHPEISLEPYLALGLDSSGKADPVFPVHYKDKISVLYIRLVRTAGHGHLPCRSPFRDIVPAVHVEPVCLIEIIEKDNLSLSSREFAFICGQDYGIDGFLPAGSYSKLLPLRPVAHKILRVRRNLRPIRQIASDSRHLSAVFNLTDRDSTGLLIYIRVIDIGPHLKGKAFKRILCSRLRPVR